MEWLQFRDEYIAAQRELRCYYCARKLYFDRPLSPSDPFLRAYVPRSRVATVDHKIPTSKGGPKFDTTNFAVACTKCNQKKAAKLFADWMQQGGHEYLLSRRAFTMSTMTFRKMVMNEDLNPAGTLFGGRLLAWIDEGAAIYAACQMHTKRVVTLKVSEMLFKEPARLGDTLEIFCEPIKYGNTSFTLSVTVKAKQVEEDDDEERIIAECEMVFVALDEYGKPTIFKRTPAIRAASKPVSPKKAKSLRPDPFELDKYVLDFQDATIPPFVKDKYNGMMDGVPKAIGWHKVVGWFILATGNRPSLLWEQTSA